MFGAKAYIHQYIRQRNIDGDVVNTENDSSKEHRKAGKKQPFTDQDFFPEQIKQHSNIKCHDRGY